MGMNIQFPLNYGIPDHKITCRKFTNASIEVTATFIINEFGRNIGRM
jgi:hypothetical protein